MIWIGRASIDVPCRMAATIQRERERIKRTAYPTRCEDDEDAVLCQKIIRDAGGMLNLLIFLWRTAQYKQDGADVIQFHSAGRAVKNSLLYCCCSSPKLADKV